MMTTVAHRATHADPLWISPAADNFAHIAARVENLFSFNRRMTLIERYVNERGADHLTIRRDLELENFEDSPAISVVEPNENHGGSLIVHFTHLHRVGFTAVDAREREAARRFETRSIRPEGVTQIRMAGGLGRPANDDFFEREFLNVHGVSEIKTVIFHR